MKKICFITSLIVVLSGCSNYVLPNGEQLGSKRWEEISDRMNKKVGLSEQELISQWGVPNGNYTLSNGSKLYLMMYIILEKIVILKQNF